MALDNFELTEEKVLKLKPIVESILSRKYGVKVKFTDLTIGNITIGSTKEEIKCQ